ncbi:hypothetical protein U0070_022287 [Myodes glareolus]|uniref:Metaxin 3 n=1 Tax=Myodes glareolus TaxID=447135 RepID=A0AAW0IBK6_MYOGA
MAAPLELSCWGGGWGLPSVHSESLVVLAYAKFSGAPLKVNVIDNTWRGPRGDVPILMTEDSVVSQPAKILNFLRKQKYNADCELSAKQGADTLAYIALLEEKLLPAVAMPLLPTALVMKPLAPAMLFLVNTLKEATQQFLSPQAGGRPSTLDAYVFGFLAPLYKVRFPKVHLQEHLKQLSNLCRLCDDILDIYFRHGPAGISPAGQEMIDANLRKLTQLVNKESNLIEKVANVFFFLPHVPPFFLFFSVLNVVYGIFTIQSFVTLEILDMDDNLRQSPQLLPRKLPTLKLTPAEDESDSLQRLSP